MKKIVNFLILIVVCFLPVMVDAKEKYAFDWSLDDKAFLYAEDGIYYFIDSETIYSGSGNLYSYDKDGNLLGEELFFDEENMSSEEIINSKRYIELFPYFSFFDSDSDYYYSDEIKEPVEVYYGNEVFLIFDTETGEDVVYKFDDDIEFTKKVLGKRYDVFNKVKDLDEDVYKINIFDNIYVAYYVDYYNHCNAYILDKDFNIIVEYKSNNRVASVYEKDGIFYVIDGNRDFAAYRLDGTVIESLNIESEWFDDKYYGSCRNLNFNKAYIGDNKLFITFRTYSTCPNRMAWADATDFVKLDQGPPMVFTLVYDLDYKVETVESSNGSITYEEKEDEDGKSYVELKITPKDGYSVKEIVVTDINGNRVEVTNNRFYMPMSDVKVEVKYINGEYLPIPDTFFSKSLTLIIIGLVLVGLGIYTINYVRGESKVDI